MRAWFHSAVAEHGESTFLVCGEEALSYEQFHKRALRLSKAFSAQGLEAGDRVVLALSNRSELVLGWFALAFIGAIEVPVNPAVNPEELAFILDDSGARWLVGDEATVRSVLRLGSRPSGLTHVVVVDADPTSMERPESDSRRLRWLRWGEPWTEDEPAQSSVGAMGEDVDVDSALAILYTSGTTGSPKGVVLSHRAGWLTGHATAHHLGMGPDDRLMTPNPLFHINAQFHGVLSAVACGAAVVLLDRFSRGRLIQQARTHEATLLLLAAAATPMLMSLPPDASDARHTLRTLLTGGVPESLYTQFERRFGLRVQTAYAMTESPLVVMAPLRDSLRKPTPGIGVAVDYPGLENAIRLVDERGDEASAGAVGEVWVKNRAMMTGYWSDKLGGADRADVSSDGWHRTGDLVRRDEEGYYFFVGRKDDRIRHRGEMISPAQVERVLEDHPAVRESVVIGVASDLGVGEQDVVAFLLPVRDALVDLRDVRDHCARRLASFKVPVAYAVVTEIPRTALGKVRKKDLPLGSLTRLNS